jgi:ribosomal peptide maturation radical SAM protein 1
VLLLSMPYGALERPALGISLLKPLLARAGVECDVRYLNFPLAELLGYGEYQWMQAELPYTAFAGDWTFTTDLHGPSSARDEGFVREVLRGQWRLDSGSIDRILQVRALVGHFLDHCMAAVDWSRYGLVGFTSTFEQNLASLALARRIKERHPEVGIVFGGANWEGEMGCELHRRFPFVDYACSGEAELSFPALVERVLGGGGEAGLEGVPGIVFRRGGESVFTGAPPLTRDLDALPIPDFGDYFAALRESSAGSSISPMLLVETSRGCWWGAKAHCTFCGLNGSGMSFRSKSGRRAVEEIEHLADRWQGDTIEAVDNIFDMGYFESVLPVLAGRTRRLNLFYEIKANLTREQVRLLAQAGVYRIQPGLESLSDHILKLMRKGTTALRNVQLLKWCREMGIHVDWNLLYGFPGETAEDYAASLELLRSIRHLQPAGACGPVRLDRFSPYFTDPEAFGLVDVRPMVSYRYLYPFDEASLRRIAYYFDYGYRPEVDPRGAAAEVVRYVKEWRDNPEQGTLWAVPSADGGLVIHDSRSDAPRAQVALSPPEAAAYRYCDELRSGKSVARFLRGCFPEAGFPDDGILAFLDSLVANRLMVTDGTHYLGLALGAAPPQEAKPVRETGVDPAKEALLAV